MGVIGNDDPIFILYNSTKKENVIAIPSRRGKTFQQR